MGVWLFTSAIEAGIADHVGWSFEEWWDYEAIKRLERWHERAKFQYWPSRFSKTPNRSHEIGRGYAHFHHTSYSIASAYALMNRREEALKWLLVTADEGFPCYPLFKGDTNLDNLRKDPRFISFMANMKQQWEHYNATL